MHDVNSATITLDAHIEQQILEDRQNNRRNPLAFKDAFALRRKDLEHDRATTMRPAFSRDIEKIINVPAYNRYADKTQVFSFVQNDDISRRGLHVQLVSRIARNIGEILGLNTSLIEAIALGHDIGHTPFGHAGEDYLSRIFHSNTGLYFRHNVHSVRVLDKLFPRNISLQTLDGIVCHNGEFAQQVLQMSDLDNFEDFDNIIKRCYTESDIIKTLRPSTLEGCVVRVADMIAYIGKDRQDAISLGCLDANKVFTGDVIGHTNAQIITNLCTDIINNSYGKDKIALSDDMFNALKTAKRENYEYIYNKEGVSADHGNIVGEMFELVYNKCRQDLIDGCKLSPIYKHHVKYLSKKSRSVSPEEYKNEEVDMIVADYIAGMTDSYFNALFEFMFPNSNLSIITQDYCSGLRVSTE